MLLLELEQKRPREMHSTVRSIVLPAEGLGVRARGAENLGQLHSKDSRWGKDIIGNNK